MKLKIKERFDATEPMPCTHSRCKEVYNGVNIFTLSFGEGFYMEAWFCNECAEKFRKKIKDGIEARLLKAD